MALWDNIKRELANLWEILTTGEALPPIEETPEEPEEYEQEAPEETGGVFGDFFGDEEPEQPEPPPVSDGDETFGYEAGDGPYPDNWGGPQERFWDRQMDTYIFQNETQYDEAQRAFYDGYMAGDDEIDTEDRIIAREEFLDITYFSDIDWDAFAEYYDETT